MCILSHTNTPGFSRVFYPLKQRIRKTHKVMFWHSVNQTKTTKYRICGNYIYNSRHTPGQIQYRKEYLNSPLYYYFVIIRYCCYAFRKGLCIPILGEEHAFTCITFPQPKKCIRVSEMRMRRLVRV